MREFCTAASMEGQPYHMADGSLRFVPAAIKIYVRPGSVREGSVAVSGREGDSVRGFTGCTGYRMQCVTQAFTGNPDTILWRYDASFCRDGDKETGFLRIFSSHGEYKVPFEVLIQEAPAREPDRQGKGVRELEASGAQTHPFAVSARRDWEGAVRRFYQNSFGSTLRGDKEKLLWRGLRVYPGNEQNVEEFLIAACGKKPVLYEADCKEIHAELPWQLAAQIRAEAGMGRYRGANYGGRDNRIQRYGSRDNRVREYGSRDNQIREYGSRDNGSREPDRSGQESGYREIVLRIRRSGWGYTNLEVHCDGAFFENSGIRLTREDFYEDLCTLRLRVDLRRLHAGRNYGRIDLVSAWQRTSLPVEVHCRRSEAGQTKETWEIQGLLVSMTRAYERLRLGRIQTEEWVRQTQELIRRLSFADRNAALPGLYRAHLLLLQERVHAAILELEAVRRKLAGVRPGEVLEMDLGQYPQESDAEYAYRIFLTAAAYRDEEGITPRVIRLLRDRYRRTPGEWRIAWMLLQLSGEYAPGSDGRWLFLQKQYVNGARSPILYLEAWDLVQQDPSVLNLQRERQSGRHDTDAFEQHLLLYAYRKGLLSEPVMQQVLEMTARRRTFSPILFQVMTSAYETENLRGIRTEILQAVCSMLIRSGTTGPDYFVWFSRAVEHKLPLMRLADCYLQSMPEDFSGLIPDSVMRGAARPVSLPAEGRSYYYRYLYENRGRYAQIYEETLPAIGAWLRLQAQRGRMNRDLAALYLAAGRDPELGLTQEMREDLSRLSYMCLLRTTRLSMRRAVLVYPQEQEEKRYPVENGCCTLPVFGEDNCILFEDSAGCRYAVTVPYTLDRVMEPLPAQEEGRALSETDIAYALEISGAAREDFEVTPQNVKACEFLAGSRRTAPSFRARLQLLLLRYYEGGGPAAAKELIAGMDPHAFSREEQAEIAGLLAGFGLYREGVQWLMYGGTRAVPARVCAELLTGAAGMPSKEREEPVSADLLAGLALEVMRENTAEEREQGADAALLPLLLTGGEFLAAEREAILERAERAGCSREEIRFAEMNLLRQSLFTGEVTDGQPHRILQALQSGEAYKEAGERSLEQYLSRCLSRQEKPDPMVLQYLEETEQAGGAVTDFGRAALLFAAEREESGFLRRQLRILVRKGIVFPFFREFPFAEEELAEYAGETMLEYHDPSGGVGTTGHVVIHYAQERAGRQEPFRAREMKEMLRGFYVSSFYLFYGEQLHYFITDDPQEKNITESGTISRDLRISGEGTDRFGILDSLTALAAAGRREEAMEGLARYRLQRALTEELFGNAAAGAEAAPAGQRRTGETGR